MRVCIGGTFNNLHRGHLKLIEEAFKIADESGTVFIGVTIDEFAHQNKKPYKIDTRIRNLESYLEGKGFIDRVIIKPISDKYGPTIEEDFDVIVVSPETYNTAVEINDKRIEKGKKPMKIIKISYVLAKDGRPISSTRINNKEIDKDGNVILKD